VLVKATPHDAARDRSVRSKSSGAQGPADVDFTYTTIASGITAVADGGLRLREAQRGHGSPSARWPTAAPVGRAGLTYGFIEPGLRAKPSVQRAGPRSRAGPISREMVQIMGAIPGLADIETSSRRASRAARQLTGRAATSIERRALP